MSATPPPSVNPRRRRAALLAATAAAVVGALLTTACLPAQASNVRITRSLFGMHDGTAGSSSYGTVHEGSVRLWDAGVRWSEIQTTKSGPLDWTRLDQLVSAADAHNVSVTMVVAGTPSFYSSTPWNVPDRAFGPYKAFVHKLMERYRGKIDNYQVWNEPNISSFWTGSKRRMAEMTKAMHDIRNAVAPKAKVIAPSLVTRLPFEQAWIKGYETQRLNGKPVWRYYDAVALSLYPTSKVNGRPGVPEDTITLLNQIKKRLRGAGVPASMPIWDSEINYGLKSGGGGTATPISASKQAANVVRTYLLQSANNVKRIFWYRYDWGPTTPAGGTLGNTILTSPFDSTKVTAAGRAYALVQKWMHGKLVGKPGHRPCTKNSHGTYLCVVTDSSGTKRIYWNPFHKAKVKVANTARHKQGVLGSITRIRGGSTLTVNYAPVMVYH